MSFNGLAVAEPAKPLGSQAQLQTRLKLSSLAPHARRPVGSKAAFRRPEPATDLVIRWLKLVLIFSRRLPNSSLKGGPSWAAIFRAADRPPGGGGWGWLPF